MVKDYYMSSDEWTSFKKDTRMFKELNNNRYYCKCGHSVIIGRSFEKTLCTWCNHYVYKDKQLQEEYDKKVLDQENKIKRDKFKKELLKRL